MLRPSHHGESTVLSLPLASHRLFPNSRTLPPAQRRWWLLLQSFHSDKEWKSIWRAGFGMRYTHTLHQRCCCQARHRRHGVCTHSLKGTYSIWIFYWCLLILIHQFLKGVTLHISKIYGRSDPSLQPTHIRQLSNQFHRQSAHRAQSPLFLSWPWSNDSRLQRVR